MTTKKIRAVATEGLENVLKQMFDSTRIKDAGQEVARYGVYSGCPVLVARKVLANVPRPLWEKD